MDADLRLLHRVVPSVVHIHAIVDENHATSKNLGRERMGTGTIVDPRGYILTVNYVILGAHTMTVTLIDGTVIPGKLVCQDYDSGLGLVRVDRENLPALPIQSSQSLALGDCLFIVSSVDGAERRVNDGVVSSLAPFDAFWEYMLERSIMLTGFNPGYGGGPLINTSGKMVGVVSLNLNEVGRFSLAIPGELYLDYREEMMQQGRAQRPKKAWLGFYPHPSEEGLQVAGVVANGPAQTQGLKGGDMVLAINSCRVATRRELYTELWKRKPSERVSLSILRGGAVLTVEVVAGDRDEFYK
jgi:S1-C subfamily serine protease